MRPVPGTVHSRTPADALGDSGLRIFHPAAWWL